MGIRVVFMSVPELAGIFLCGDFLLFWKNTIIFVPLY